MIANDNDPFDGLCEEDAKRMEVYLSRIAPNRMTNAELFQRYGHSSCSIDLLEGVRLVADILKRGVLLHGKNWGNVNSKLQDPYDPTGNIDSIVDDRRYQFRMPCRRDLVGELADNFDTYVRDWVQVICEKNGLVTVGGTYDVRPRLILKNRASNIYHVLINYYFLSNIPTLDKNELNTLVSSATAASETPMLANVVVECVEPGGDTPVHGGLYNVRCLIKQIDTAYVNRMTPPIRNSPKKANSTGSGCLVPIIVGLFSTLFSIALIAFCMKHV